MANIASTVDTTAFSHCVRDIQRRLSNLGENRTVPDIIRSEVASVLTRCIQMQSQRLPTKGDLLEKDELRMVSKFHTVSMAGAGSVAYRIGGEKFSPASGVRLSENAKKNAGRVWIGQPGDWTIVSDAGRARKISSAKFAMSNALATRRAYEQARQTRLRAKALNMSYGLTVHSWWQIVVSGGLDQMVKAPAYVQRAAPSNGRTYQNGTAVEITEGGSFRMEISNDSRLTISHEGASILSAAIQGRVSFFWKNLEKGVFDDLAKVAKRYPGFHVSP